MNVRAVGFAVVAAALLSLTSACVVSDRPGYGRTEAYYYYPDQEVYYYPRVQRYYWSERGEWRNGREPPSRFVLRDRERVRIDMDHEPHTDHARIRQSYPPGRYEGQERREERKEERREDRGEDRRGY
ncbi:MAG TPA: hypothetical protein VGA73_01730 [Candidatus Binatia bacterium]